MSQLYRQMEDDVARRVRETMEMADARRKALTPSDVPQRPPRKVREAPRKELGHESDAIDASVRIIESLTKELKGINYGNVTEDSNNSQKTATFHIGFEEIRDNVDKMQVGQTRQSDSDFPGPSNPSWNKRELAQGALNLAQTAAENIKRLHEGDHTNQRHLSDAELMPTQREGAVNSILDEADNTNQRHLAEGALILAQSAAWNIDNNGNETDNVGKRNLPDGELHLALDQGASTLAQHPVRNINTDKKVVGELNLELAKATLDLAKKAARNIEDAADKRNLAEGTLNLAQNAAWNIDNEAQENESGKPHLAEGALHLTQNAARDLDNFLTGEISQRKSIQGVLHLARIPAYNGSNDTGEPENSRLLREGSSIENAIGAENQQKKELQLGFDHFEAFDETMDDINRKSLAEHDRRVTAAAEAKIRTVSMDLQNIDMSINDNDYHKTPDVDKSTREFATGALNLAQVGSRNLKADVYETDNAKIRELGEGALGLARGAAMRQLSNEVGTVEKQKQTVQLGFGLLENAADSELEGSERGDTRTGTGAFKENVDSSRSNM